MRCFDNVINFAAFHLHVTRQINKFDSLIQNKLFNLEYTSEYRSIQWID